MNISLKDYFISLLINSLKQGDDIQVFQALYHSELLKISTQLINTGNTNFEISLKELFPDIDFKFYNKGIIAEEHTYKRQGGGDFYTYLQIEAKSVQDSVIKITEILPDYLQNTFDNNPKSTCSEWIAVLPYILRAFIDDCIKRQTSGVEFILLNIKFHPVDYRPLTYYTCTKQLLNKIYER